MTAGPRPTRRRSGLRWLLLAVLLIPLLEIVVLIAVGRSIGILWTLALLVAMAVLGAWLSRRETGRTYTALRTALESGRMPTDEATDAILVMLGGFLLVLPGFLTDVIGLVLVLPWTRPLARRLLQTLVAGRVLGVTGPRARGGSGNGTLRPDPAPGRGQVIEGEVVSETPPPGGWGTPNAALDQKPGQRDHT